MEVDFVTPGVIEDDTVEANNDDVSFEGERCGICMDIIIDRGVLDCCQHWFCFGCIDNWSTITNLCPLCQNEFQSITCVPVYDTIGSNKVDDESFSRNDDWSIEGQSSTLSFPSSYIDENAVICLDGDGCKIRSGMANVEEDSNLDTSIACDSCDVWYHAFCVGFDTENTSEETWLCPRCTVDEVPQKPDATSVQRPSIQCDPQSSHPNCSTNAAFSGKVSVSVADAGETAIVVSMVRESDWTGKPENIKPSFEGNEIVKVNVDNPDGKDVKVETLCTEKKGIQEILEPQGLELSLLRDASCIQPQNSNLWVTSELKISCSDEAINETRRFNGVKDSLRKFKGYFDKREQSECESTTGLHLGLSVGCFQSGDTAALVDNTNNIRIKVEDPPDRDIQQQNLSDESLSRDEKIQADSSKEAVKIVGLKRRHIDCSDDGEANDKSEDANTVKKKRDEENLQIDQSMDRNTSNALPPDSQNCAAQMRPSKDKSNALVTDDSQKCPQIALLKDVKLEQPSEKEVVDSDIMSIVQGKIRRTSMGLSLQNPAIKSSKERETVAGLRVKRIMKRASGDKESSVVVQKLRKEIREAVRNKKSADIGESLFDPKLLAAFRAAIAEATVEPSSTRLPPSALKAKKTMLQKGKVRENLTKKIYGDSNGRRKRAWDRECEIEFWKYRCTRATKPEKIATLKSVLNLLRKNPSAEGPGLDGAPECQATSPILSRLYLADTSVFPRKDDIKPLSALTSKSNSEQKRSLLVSGEKGQKTSPENCSPTEVNKVSLKPGVPSKGIQTKVPTMKDKAASSKVLPDRPSEASAQKQTGIQSDGQKIDKRKWALEVLARKKAAGGQTATNEKQEGSIVLKGNFHLLAQLPKDMWPALAASCHNKIPVPVRQTQLHRLTEHFLRKLDLPEICRNADTELAVADAINIEKEIADKSNSKVVYLNLCSQEVLRRSDSSKTDRSTESNSSPLLAIPGDRPEQSSSDLPTDPSVLEALRNAGLLSDSPPSSPSHKMGVPYEVDDSPLQSNEEGPDNVFEMDYHPEVDIYGDFEYDLEDEDFIGATAVQVTKLPPEEGESKMKLVFSTLKPEKTVDVLEAEDGGNLGNIKNPESSPSLTGHFDNNSIDSFTEQGTKKSCDKPDPLTGEEGEELSLAECEELYGPDKEPLINKFPEESRKLYGSLDAGAPSENKIPEGNENVVPSQAENNIVANLQEHTCHDEKSPEKSQTSEKVSRKEKTDADNKKHCDTGMADSVSKKVEAYIKEHIRPLCKSGIITPEQYRWAVTKTTDKVMKYHAKDKNANFLIKEGEKVKKLAQQYVEASKQK